MDAQRLGRVVRAARQARGWRQVDVAARSGVSQDLVSVVERGFADHVSPYRLRGILRCLDLELLGFEVRSRTVLVDRLIDEGHAKLVADTVELLQSSAWEVRPEVSYSRYGERGSFDLLGWHAPTGSLLAVEVKTELVSVEATIRKLDEKQRLAAIVGEERFGWVIRSVSCFLVLPRASTPYRQLVRHAAVIDLVLPARSRVARSWLRRPSGHLGAVLFVSPTDERRGRRSRKNRIRQRTGQCRFPERETGLRTGSRRPESSLAAPKTTDNRR